MAQDTAEIAPRRPWSYRKRKDTSKLSTNPNTIKVRKRNDAISQDPIRQQVEKAKAADQGAITYAKRKLLRSAEFATASEAGKEDMIRDSAASVILKRYILCITFY